MALPRLVVVTCDNVRSRRARIRGFLAEVADSELTDDLTVDLGTEQPVPVDTQGGWNRPVLSAPDVVARTEKNPGGRLCVWGLWDSTLSDEGRSQLTALAQSVASIRVFRQRADESVDDLNTRWRTALGWIDKPTQTGA